MQIAKKHFSKYKRFTQAAITKAHFLVMHLGNDSTLLPCELVIQNPSRICFKLNDDDQTIKDPANQCPYKYKYLLDSKTANPLSTINTTLLDKSLLLIIY